MAYTRDSMRRYSDYSNQQAVNRPSTLQPLPIRKEKTMTAKKPNQINIYACGGTGIEIMRKFQKIERMPGNVQAELRVVNVDTSDSNVDRNGENTFVIEGMNGSGKVRITNAQPIIDAVPMILEEYTPGDFSVVIHSSGGGSGSVAGPFLVKELLNRGKHVVVMMVGAVGSVIELENSEKSFQTYAAFSQETGRTIPMFYLENDNGMTRAEVDTTFHSYLNWLSVVFSGMNKHLDTQDLANFLDIEKVTSFEPDLVLLDIFSTAEGQKSEINVGRGEVAATVATLAPEDVDTNPGTMVPYHCEGFLPHGSTLDVGFNESLPIHLYTVVGAVAPIVQRHRAKLEDLKKGSPVVQQRSIVSDKAVKGLGGAIF